MKRVLCTEENLNELFADCETEYEYVANGEALSCRIPALKCRACGWESLRGVRGLPFPHECPGAREDVTTGFGADVKGVAGSKLNY